MQGWSYKITSLPFDENEKNSTVHLNEMGAEGWELVSVGVQAGSNSSRFYWKKYNLSKLLKSKQNLKKWLTIIHHLHICISWIARKSRDQKYTPP